MTIHLVTFSDASMSRSAVLCATSSEAHGVENWALLSPKVLPSNWPWTCKERGCGYFAWKPFIIDRQLASLRDGDILIYSDAGVEFINNVSHIIDRMDQDIFLFGNQWEHAHWCKRDIVDEVMGKCSHGGTGCHYHHNEVWEQFGKQVQASVIFFRVSDYSRQFVKEWLDWCLFEGGRLIDDSPSRAPNHPEFRENRHDQAILTTMAYRDGIKLHWWPASYNDGAFVYERGGYPDEGYPVMFNHHRKRNHEWEKVA